MVISLVFILLLLWICLFIKCFIVWIFFGFIGFIWVKLKCSWLVFISDFFCVIWEFNIMCNVVCIKCVVEWLSWIVWWWELLIIVVIVFFIWSEFDVIILWCKWVWCFLLVLMILNDVFVEFIKFIFLIWLSDFV